MALPFGESPAQPQDKFGRAKARILVAFLGLALAAGVLAPGHDARAATPPKFIQEAETSLWDATNPKTTASFNIQAGDVLVAFAMMETAAS